MTALNIADFDYDLPPELIAQTPAPQRTGSRLLDARQQPFADLRFSDIGALLRPNDVLVFNDTQVIPARLFGEKATGGKIECLIERLTTEHTVWVHLRASKMPAIGSELWLYDATLARNVHSECVTVLDRELTVKGDRPAAGKEQVYLHKGIAARPFARSFALASELEVDAASLANGLGRGRDRGGPRPMGSSHEEGRTRARVGPARPELFQRRRASDRPIHP